VKSRDAAQTKTSQQKVTIENENLHTLVA
jgi:hypothetical protein